MRAVSPSSATPSSTAGNMSEAIAEYGQALALNPNDSDIIAEYADALAYVEQPQRSVELMHKAMRLNPHYPDWYLWYLADAYDTLGQSEDVIATVQAHARSVRGPTNSRGKLCPSRNDARG